MTARTGRIWIVAAAVFIVPALITAVVYISLKYTDTHRFDRCLAGIPEQNLNDPGVSFILEGLKGTGRYEGASWNINKKYRSDSYNILVPSGSVSKWPEACEVPEGAPDCLASPQNRYIICNPAMGQQFESRLLHSGAASAESDAAMRFVLLTFLGHELGHISMSHSSHTRHLIPNFHVGSLSCVHHPLEESEEEKADNFGTDLACQSIVRRLSTEDLSTDPAEGLRLVSRLQDQLDDNYFLSDDACVGDVAYPSIGRRKHTFSLKYLQCIYPSQWNPNLVLAEEDAKSFSDLEKWLESRQKFGQIASGSYGRATLYAHTVMALPKPESYLTFDSTGVDSTLWLIQPGKNQEIQVRGLQTWQSVGHLLNLQETVEGPHLWISLEHGPQADNGVLLNLEISCSNGVPSCGLSSAPQKVPIPKDFRPVAGTDGSIAMISKDFVERSLPSNSVTVSKVRHGLNLKSIEDAVVAVTPNQTVILPRSGGGMHDVSVVRGNTIDRRLLMMPPAEGEALEAVAVHDGRVLLSSHVSPLTGEGSLFLWDCPSALLERSATSPQDDCVRYKAPSEIEQAVSLATRDLSSMFDLSIRFPTDCSDVLAVQHRGWLWIIDRTKGLQDLLAADGIVHCDLQKGEITTFRARRIDQLVLSMRPVARDKQSILSVAVTN